MSTPSKPIVVRNAIVEVKLAAHQGNPCLRLVITCPKTGQVFDHTFAANSTESLELMQADMDTIVNKYNGGHFVFDANGNYADYRKADYSGYMQSDEAVDRLSEIIGMKQTKAGGKYQTGVAGLYDAVRTRNTNGALFGGEADPFAFDVKELGQGGDFTASLMSKWSVFSPNIELSLNVKRLVCTNGMVADAPFVTRAVPVINNWEENMNVVHAQLEPHMSGILQDRFRRMANQPASVATLSKAHKILNSRMMGDSVSDAERRNILTMMDIVNPKEHLGSVYTDRVFNDARAANAMTGHLTQFDVFNVLTEASSHYGRDSKTDGESTILLNSIMFDELKSRTLDTGTIKPSADSDHRRAFFGK